MQRLQTTRRSFLGGIGASLVTPSLVHAAQTETLTGAAFGTQWSVVGSTDAMLSRLRPDLEALFSDIDQEMSPWRSDSVLTQFNDSLAGAPESTEMLRVARMAMDLAHRTQGAFDPTIGPLVAKWGFGPIAREGTADWRLLSIEEDRLVKADSDLTLDFCGIAKGRALDRAADLARRCGAEHALLDIGGELRAIGRHPEGRDWRVAVAHPEGGSQSPAVVHLPPGMAVATSGLGAQSYALQGRLWGHIIDPSKAQPVQGELRSVTVLASDAMTADGWATALFAAGDAEGPALARENDIDALFLYSARSGLPRLATGSIADVLR